jgi:serine protease inhibitor
MTRASRSPILACVALLAACGASQGVTEPEPLLTQLPRPLSAAELRLVDAGNQFTLDLFRAATAALPADSNAFLSPLSASMALGMALNGAGGETFDAMRTALRVDAVPLGDINQGYKDLTALLTGLDRATTVLVANSVWSHTAFPILPTFVTAARTWFDAEARSVDFRAPEAVAAINGWVKEKTRDRIPKLLESIDQREVAFLINAVYFKGKWRDAFDPARTKPLPFNGADGATRNVPTMSHEPGPHRYAATPDYEAVDLLYGNGAFALTVLLPRPGKTPRQVLAGLTPAAWRALGESFAEARVGLELPKFRMDYTRELKDDLRAMGMGIAFDGARADFSGIADVRPDRLFITRVLQKTFVEVNEEGTEAAAATGVGMGVTSVPPTVRVDRPFLFAIRERSSGTILFLAQMNVIR